MSDIKIYTRSNLQELHNIPILTDGQIYLYVMLNAPQGNIKIGITTNIIQRLQSLSGSNGGGSKVTQLFVSEPTYIKSIEKTCHNHYNRFRIPNTEWFKGSDLDFNEVVKYVDSLFRTRSYEVCNELRRQQLEKDRTK